MIIVSLYSIASDLILIAQFIYYKLHHQAVLAIVSHALGHGEVTLEESDPLPILESATASDRTSLLGTEDIARANPTYTRVPALYSTVGLLAISACSFASTAYHLISSSTPSVDFGNSHSPTRSSPRGFLITELPDSTISHSSLLPQIGAKIGYTLGTISSVMYICSRFPQIFLNWKRGSTKGLCLGLFSLAIFGNVLYGLQIFLASLETSYLLRSLPWLIGSLGTVFLDLILLGSTFRCSPIDDTVSVHLLSLSLYQLIFGRHSDANQFDSRYHAQQP
ncbi:unnamed protein product [Dicrocoelium dendriticum]|nr:unnamed protein product [Dicrocoelium dendriticum]